MDPVALRAQFPVLAERAYLNAGTCGPLAQATADAQTAVLARALREGRAGEHFEAWMAARATLRASYAGLLSAEPEDVALTSCTSDGMVRVLLGAGLQRGDEVLTAPDEHPGLLGPLAAVRRELGVEVRTAPLADLADAVTSRTRMVACSHVSWVTGALAPALPDDVLVLLDGAQAVGAIPVDVSTLRCDFYAGPGQKWLGGPIGTGMLWVSPAWRDRLLAPGPTYINLADASAGLDAVAAADASRHDSAAISLESWAGAQAAHDVLAQAGWPAVHARAVALAGRFAERLQESGRTVAPRGETTLVSWEEDDPEAVRDRLVAAGVIVRNLPGTPYVRASVGAWNDEDDLDRLIAALGPRTA